MKTDELPIIKYIVADSEIAKLSDAYMALTIADENDKKVFDLVLAAIAKATGQTEYDTAKQEASAWRDKANRDDHPGRGFCLTQVERWEAKAEIAKAEGKHPL
jgi:hypothetical protein